LDQEMSKKLNRYFQCHSVAQMRFGRGKLKEPARKAQLWSVNRNAWPEEPVEEPPNAMNKAKRACLHFGVGRRVMP
jgi:hypothetical protein